MNNKMKLGIAMMMLTASLSLVLLSTPSKVAIAQTSPENQTMIQHPKKDYYIASELTEIDITQLRDEIRSNYPLLDAIADRIQTMDARETLRYTIGVEIVADLLQAHAAQLIMNQTAGNQTGIP
jgi:hypothetical protein